MAKINDTNCNSPQDPNTITPSLTNLSGNGTSVTEISSQIVDDFESDPKYYSTLEKAHFELTAQQDQESQPQPTQGLVKPQEQHEHQEQQFNPDNDMFDPSILNSASVDKHMEKVINDMVQLDGCKQFVQALENEQASEAEQEREVQNIQREISGVLDPQPEIINPPPEKSDVTPVGECQHSEQQLSDLTQLTHVTHFPITQVKQTDQEDEAIESVEKSSTNATQDDTEHNLKDLTDGEISDYREDTHDHAGPVERVGEEVVSACFEDDKLKYKPDKGQNEEQKIESCIISEHSMQKDEPMKETTSTKNDILSENNPIAGVSLGQIKDSTVPELNTEKEAAKTDEKVEDERYVCDQETTNDEVDNRKVDICTILKPSAREEEVIEETPLIDENDPEKRNLIDEVQSQKVANVVISKVWSEEKPMVKFETNENLNSRKKEEDLAKAIDQTTKGLREENSNSADVEIEVDESALEKALKERSEGAIAEKSNDDSVKDAPGTESQGAIKESDDRETKDNAHRKVDSVEDERTADLKTVDEETNRDTAGKETVTEEVEDTTTVEEVVNKKNKVEISEGTAEVDEDEVVTGGEAQEKTPFGSDKDVDQPQMDAEKTKESETPKTERPLRAARLRTSQRLSQPEPPKQLTKQPKKSFSKRPIGKDEDDFEVVEEPVIKTKRPASSRNTIATSTQSIKPNLNKRSTFYSDEPTANTSASDNYIDPFARDRIPNKLYNCDKCAFSTDRINNMIVHKKPDMCKGYKEEWDRNVAQYKSTLASPKSNKKRVAR